MYANEELTVSNPVGDEQVVPTTLLSVRRESEADAEERPRRGERDGRARKGELEGVSLSRLLEGVEAMSSPLTQPEGDGFPDSNCGGG